MVNVYYNDKEFQCAEGQSVLEVLLENEQDVPNSCKMGVCVTCIMQVVAGDLPTEAQTGLRQSLIKKGLFMPCVCHPKSDIHIAKIESGDFGLSAVVVRIDHITKDICRVFLEPTKQFDYRPGQFVNLRRADALARSFSLSSVPDLDGLLEVHVKRLPRGRMSNWILDELRPGMRLELQGPYGDCFYRSDHKDRNLLLIASGTGLAPLLGIARDALAKEHNGEICLYHGTSEQAGHYLKDQLSALDVEHKNFTYIPCVSNDLAKSDQRRGRADDIAFSDHNNVSGQCVFISGYGPMVQSAERKAIERGAIPSDIYLDPHALRDLREVERTMGL